MGDLVPGPPEQTIPKLRSIISRTKPPMVITVGDVVSREAIRGGIKVDVQIIDTKTMRKPLGLAVVPGRVKTYHVQNPAGVIRMGSWETVRNALREKNTTIVVEGEEDLLAIPSILEAPEGALVLYGQPNQGVVLVKASGPIRDELAAMVQEMVKESA